MIVGIDLGTTHSLVAVWKDGRAQLIKNGLGEVLTPSCVSLDKDGSVLVGKAARERLQTHPELSTSLFKRYMGSAKTVRLGKRELRPEELSALVLKSLKADAEAFLGEPVTEAIITVPAYFSDAQRKATRAAGEMAGLRVERLLNEPTAAALAYGMHLRGSEARFLVFDLGGGTFDVSILELFEGVMEVRASAGDNFLGGEDFVHALCDLFFQRLNLSESLRRDAGFMQRLSAQAETAKRLLSSAPSAWMRVRHKDAEHALEIDESALEQVAAPLLKRLRAPVERALRDANLRANQLDNIVLAGGATRMPIVRKLATLMFGRFPATDINPDEVVALGAAVQAGLRMRDAALQEVVMTDVSPYSLGVEVSVQVDAQSWSSGHFDPVIERNTAVPVSRVKSYTPVGETARQIDLRIFQGEGRMVRDNIHLGNLTIPLPPRAPERDTSVDVRFTYDVNGLLQVEATVAATQEKVSIVIQGNEGLLSSDEVTERLKALETLKIHPRDKLENRSLLARSERLYEQFRGAEREWLGAQILKFERLLASQDERLVASQRRDFEALLDRAERDSFLNPEPR